MTKLVWDNVGERLYETGVDRGVLYLPDNTGAYSTGFPWNGLTTVTESPGGGDSNKQYADNIVYVNLQSAEEFGGTIEAFTYPDAWAQCDGTALLYGGVAVGQQTRKPFGLSYRSLIGNDLKANDYGYKLHLVYNGLASPSEKAFATVNDSPSPIGFSWDFSCTPVAVGTVAGTDYKPSSILTIDSTKVTLANLQALEDLLYGTAGTGPSLPLPSDVIALFTGSLTDVAAVPSPTFASTTGVVTIPTTTGVDYRVDGAIKTGTYTIAGGAGSSKIVTATAKPNYHIAANVDTDWQFTRTA